MVPLRQASTVVLLRDGLEVFMVKRHGKSPFMPSAWVFPGGRVDAADHLVGHPRVRGGRTDLLGLDPPEGVAHLVAGVRETLEEAGLWLGHGEVPEADRARLAAGDVSLEALLESHDLTVDLDRLVPWSRWVTPTGESRRYDTRFFVAACEGVGHHDGWETVASGWAAPRDLLARADRGELLLAPPTWWTLQELAQLDSVEQALERGPTRSQRPIQPIHRSVDGRLELLLPGHPEHPDPAVPGFPTRIEL